MTIAEELKELNNKVFQIEEILRESEIKQRQEHNLKESEAHKRVAYLESLPLTRFNLWIIEQWRNRRTY